MDVSPDRIQRTLSDSRSDLPAPFPLSMASITQTHEAHEAHVLALRTGRRPAMTPRGDTVWTPSFHPDPTRAAVPDAEYVEDEHRVLRLSQREVRERLRIMAFERSRSMALAFFADTSADKAAALAAYVAQDESTTATAPLPVRAYSTSSAPATTTLDTEYAADAKADTDYTLLKRFSFPRHQRCYSVSGSPRESRSAPRQSIHDDAPATCGAARLFVRWKDDAELVEVRVFASALDADEEQSLAEMFPNATAEELALLWLPDDSVPSATPSRCTSERSSSRSSGIWIMDRDVTPSYLSATPRPFSPPDMYHSPPTQSPSGRVISPASSMASRLLTPASTTPDHAEYVCLSVSPSPFPLTTGARQSLGVATLGHTASDTVARSRSRSAAAIVAARDRADSIATSTYSRSSMFDDTEAATLHIAKRGQRVSAESLSSESSFGTDEPSVLGRTRYGMAYGIKSPAGDILAFDSRYNVTYHMQGRPRPRPLDNNTYVFPPCSRPTAFATGPPTPSPFASAHAPINGRPTSSHSRTSPRALHSPTSYAPYTVLDHAPGPARPRRDAYSGPSGMAPGGRQARLDLGDWLASPLALASPQLGRSSSPTPMSAMMGGYDAPMTARRTLTERAVDDRRGRVPGTGRGIGPWFAGVEGSGKDASARDTGYGNAPVDAIDVEGVNAALERIAQDRMLWVQGMRARDARRHPTSACHSTAT